jgi:SsrA-binding protein
MSSKYLNHSPTRKRKLLLTKKEINKVAGNVKVKGTTIVPLLLYINDKNIAKMKIALAKGKKLYDKRQDLKDRDLKRDKEISMKGYK